MDPVAKQILQALLRKESSLWEVISSQDGYLAKFATTLTELVSNGLVQCHQGRLNLTTAGYNSDF